ncbi:MAG: hypothetical protein N2170_05720 [Bacteroidia bacterium]|nr:hypothetical protein [Bacteroidia bacterium]
MTHRLILLGTFVYFKAYAQNEVAVEITSYTARESGGFYKVVGEVRNTYKEPLCFVKVEIQYLDEKGQPLGVDRFTAKDAGIMGIDEVFTERKVIPSGETAPFSRIRDLSKIRGKVSGVKISATGLRLRSLETTATLSQVETQAEGKDFIRVKGLYMASGMPAKSPYVVAVAYDASGKPSVVTSLALTSDGTARGTPLRQAEPGKSYPFSFTIGELGAGSLLKTVRVFPSWECE